MRIVLYILLNNHLSRKERRYPQNLVKHKVEAVWPLEQSRKVLCCALNATRWDVT